MVYRKEVRIKKWRVCVGMCCFYLRTLRKERTVRPEGPRGDPGEEYPEGERSAKALWSAPAQVHLYLHVSS